MQYDETVYDEIVETYAEFANHIGLDNVTAVPVSALCGDNILTRSAKMPWYHGPTLLSYLETAEVNDEHRRTALNPFC